MRVLGGFHAKQTSLKLSAIALSILLASCGGGGSDGYFNQGGNANGGGTGGTDEIPPDESTDPVVDEVTVLELNSSQAKLPTDGGEFEVTVRLTDNNGGGVANKDVILFLDQEARNSGLVNAGVAQQQTDSNGYAKYILNLKKPLNSSLIAQLISKGLNITAIYNTADQKQLIHTLNIKLDDGTAGDTEVTLYDLRLSANKSEANVKGDNIFVEAQVINTNGAVISGQKVTLKVLDAKNNFVILTADEVSTNNIGVAKFEIAIPSTLTTEQRNTLVSNGIKVEATTIDTNGNIALTPFTIPVTAEAGNQVIPNITFGRTNKLATVGELDYQEQMSVRVIDNDGNPIKDTAFTIDMQVINKASGHFRLGKSFEDDLALDKANLNTDIQNKNADISLLITRQSALENKKNTDPLNFTPEEDTELKGIPKKITYATDELKSLNAKKARLDAYKLPARIQYSCTAEKLDNAIATKLSGDKLTSIGNSYTATTNDEGEFKFNLTYFKSYAAWQVVQLNVKPKATSVAYSMSYDYPLNYLKNDFESEDPQPFDMSPYNQNSLVSPCPTFKPWLHLL